MISPIKSISLFLLLMLLLTGFFPSTAFCTQKPEDSTSGLTGTLTIGPDGHIYIKFTKKHAAYKIGKVITGEIPLEELTTDQADQHVLQKAAYEAYNAWLKCEEAKKKFANGKIALIQTEFECARYNKLAAQELFFGTKAILDNLGSKVEWAGPANEISKLDLENAENEMQNALDNGAVQTVLGYEPPGEGEPPPINLSDPGFNKNLILDTLPLSDRAGASLFRPNL
jgi:hypothetical protein